MRAIAYYATAGLIAALASAPIQAAQDEAKGGTDLLTVYLQVQQLEQKVRRMRGEIDSLKHQLAQNRRANQRLYQDLRQRMNGSGSAGSAPGGAGQAGDYGSGALGSGGAGASGSGSGAASKNAAASGGASAGASSASAGRDQYDAAFQQLKDGHYAKGTAAFKRFVAKHPESELVDRAYYWMGEGYYVQQRYGPAKSAFQHVVNDSPQSPKVPDSLYKIALIDIRSGQKDNAASTLQRIVDRYEDSDTAARARKKLDELGQ